MTVRCASRRWLGRSLGLAVIAAAFLCVASNIASAEPFRGGPGFRGPGFRGPGFHGPFFHGPFFARGPFFHGPFVGPRVFVGVGPVVVGGPVYPYPYPYAYPYPYPYYVPPVVVAP
jgi:hypothetical protein